MGGIDLQEDEAMDLISAFVNIAEEKSFNVYARNIPTLEMAASAIALGVRYVFASEASSFLMDNSSPFETESLCDKSHN